MRWSPTARPGWGGPLTGSRMDDCSSPVPTVAARTDGSMVLHADLGAVADYRWNEIVVDGRGNTYVNGFGFDFLGGEPPSPGIIALVSPDGSGRTVATDIEFPNGMVITPDNATLIVSESFAGRLTAFA